MSEVFKVTPEMAKAYVEWEAPIEVQFEMPVSKVLGLVRAAFFAGWLASKWVQPVANPESYQRFRDGSLKPFLSPDKYDDLRNDDRFLYNRGPKPEGLE